MSRYTDQKGDIRVSRVIIDIGLAFVFVIVLLMGGCPFYNVWERGMSGRAELMKAEQNRKIRIEEASARKESAQYEAEAEIIRASGVAEANRIIANGLGGPEGYLRYLYIDALRENAGKLGQVIYVPTEAGLPIMEATRLSGLRQKTEE